MDYTKLLTIAHLASGVLMMAFILLQQRGSGLSSMLIGGMDASVFRTKRGLEKGVFYGTIILAIIFLGTALGRLFLIS